MAKKKWRLIVDGKNNGSWNMAVDKALLYRYKEIGLPTLRFYQWDMPTLSLGYFQDLTEDIKKICQKNNVNIVRRPTGGKAVLHDDEITYSIVAPYYLFSEERYILKVYNKIARAFLNAFKNINIDAQLSVSNVQNNSSMFCFAEASYYEITVNGKKLIGNAQRYNRDIFLQHGSLPIGRNLILMNELFGKEQENKWTSLQECLGYRPDINNVYYQIINAFENIFDFKFESMSYSNLEIDMANEYKSKLSLL